MTTDQIKEKIRQFIVETTFAPAEPINDDKFIFIEGIFDSMGFVSLINFIEDAFAIKAKDSELLEDNFESINAMSRFIESKLN